MKEFLKASLVVLLAFFCLSCKKDDFAAEKLPPKHTDQTIFMYMPWSTNLTSYFYQNIEDFKKAIEAKASESERVVCFFATSPYSATLFEIRYFDGELRSTDLKNYAKPVFTQSEDLADLIDEVKEFAPSNRYSMIVSSHGMGWIPVSYSKSVFDREKMHWEYENVPQTRYFGGLSAEYQTNITTLAEALELSQTHMEYILFDDCYMSNIEVAYDLREVADYLIASPTEVMVFGFPYEHIGGDLLGEVDYDGIVKGFHDFYTNYTYPHGTVAVIRLSEVDKMASVMREINETYEPQYGIGDSFNMNKIQRMDGYSPVVFFDFASYIEELCGGTQLESAFLESFKKLVPFSAHTNTFYAASRGAISISTYCGLTISDVSESSKAIQKTATAWYKATHAE